MLRSPTVGQQSPHSRPTVDGKLHIRQQMTVYQLWANSQLTVFGELFFTFSTLASAVKRMHVLVASYEFLVHVIFFWHPLSV